jgi:hypothetical protein
VPTSSDPAAKTGKRVAETVHGRLAMATPCSRICVRGCAGVCTCEDSPPRGTGKGKGKGGTATPSARGEPEGGAAGGAEAGLGGRGGGEAEARRGVRRRGLAEEGEPEARRGVRRRGLAEEGEAGEEDEVMEDLPGEPEEEPDPPASDSPPHEDEVGYSHSPPYPPYGAS